MVARLKICGSVVLFDGAAQFAVWHVVMSDFSASLWESVVQLPSVVCLTATIKIEGESNAQQITDLPLRGSLYRALCHRLLGSLMLRHVVALKHPESNQSRVRG